MKISDYIQVVVLAIDRFCFNTNESTFVLETTTNKKKRNLP